MNITIINRMMGERIGGGENFDINIANKFVSRGHQVRILTGGYKNSEKPIDLSDQVSFYVLKTPYISKYSYPSPNATRVLQVIAAVCLEFDLWLFENKVFRHLRNDKWSNVYQICGLPRLGARLTLANKVKSYIRWPGPPSRRKLKNMLRCEINFANGDAYKYIRKNLVPSVRHIPIGVDVNWFQPTEGKSNHDLCVFLFVGRIIPIKNLTFLVKCFLEAHKRIPHIQLHIVGNGNIREIKKIKGMAQRCANVVFTGALFGHALVKKYQQSDVFLLTSKYDNYPNVILEAMASGLPCVATAVGGIPYQIDDGKTGRLIQPGNEEQMIEAIIEMASDKSIKTKYGLAGRKKVIATSSWEVTVNKLLKMYRG